MVPTTQNPAIAMRAEVPNLRKQRIRKIGAKR